MFAGILLFGEWLAVAVGIHRERIVDCHRCEVAVFVERFGLREVPGALQVGRKGGDSLA